MSRVKKETRGKPTILTSETIANIKSEVLAGLELREIAEKLSIAERTLYHWKDTDYLQLGSLWNKWEAERMLKQAEKFSNELMKMSTLNEKGLPDKGLIAIKQKESEFLREKLLIARDKYNSGNVTNINVQLPQPIIDLGKVVSVDGKKSLEK